MISLLRENWIKDPQLRKFNSVSCTDKTPCKCGNTKHHVELWEHDSCVRGRIDTVVCTKCNSVVDFDIIR